MKKILGLLLLLFADSLHAEEQTHKKMAGWSVSADARVGKEQLNTLEATLKDLNTLFPPNILTVIQRVPIHVDGGNNNQQVGIIKTGFYESPRMNVINGVMKPIGVGKVHLVSSSDCGNKILLVHELSHAAQTLTIGIDNVQVKKAYQDVVTKKLYPMPPAKDSYLMTNHREYFAEMSVVYLMKLHYFPHDRETLKKHDPISYKLMEDYWGKPTDKTQKQLPSADNPPKTVPTTNLPKAIAQEPVTKVAIPNDAAQKKASAVIADVYKPDYEKAKTTAQKIDLAKKLLAEGIATKDDPVGRFVLFKVARDIAAQQADLSLAFEAIDKIDFFYESFSLEMKVEAARIANKNADTNQQFRIAKMLLGVIDSCVWHNHFPEAKSACEIALASARQGREGDQVKLVIAKTKEVEEISVEYEKVKVAETVFQDKPTDTEANLMIGRYCCLFKGDWQTGVSMLARGRNGKLKEASLLELQETSDAIKIGDSWWNIALELDDVAKSQAQSHATGCNRQPGVKLGGLGKTACFSFG